MLNNNGAVIYQLPPKPQTLLTLNQGRNLNTIGNNIISNHGSSISNDTRYNLLKHSFNGSFQKELPPTIQ